jgi:uncharacterized protein
MIIFIKEIHFILMKKLLAFLFLLVTSISVFAQNSDSAWVMSHYGKMEKYIIMRDGVRLFTSIYYPLDNSENHPILMERTPYSCSPYGERNYKDFWNSYLMKYLQEGYIMVTQDVRGRWMSEGHFTDVRPFNPAKKGMETDESSDAYDAIDWLVKNIPYNNGKVGVFGISYPGFFSTMAAAGNHPALVAVSPQAPVTNWFIGDDFHHNGVFFVMDAFSFYSPMGGSFGVPHPRPTTVAPLTIDYPSHDSYKFYLEMGPLSEFSKICGDSVEFWKDLYAHPDYDSWWQARDARNATKTLHPAMLWVGGLFDAEDNWGAWNSYKAAEKNNPGKEFNKLVMGPWYHTQWANWNGTHLGNVQFGQNTSTWYQKNVEVPFFNYFLKGKGSISSLAEATIFITGENAWHSFSEWPPAGAKDNDVYLSPSGRLGFQAPGANGDVDEYISDPAHPVPYTEDVHFNRTRTYMTDDQRFAERRPDVLTFQSGILDKNVTVTGVVKADLFVSLSTTDADFVVKLIDVFPDSLSYNDVNIYDARDPVLTYPMGGYEMLVHGEIFRGRYRNSYEKPEAFVPGKVEEVSYAIGDVAHTFQRGHRIMIQVQSSWFPLADRNPQKFVNIYQAKPEDFQKATIRVYHDADHPSKVILPILVAP